MAIKVIFRIQQIIIIIIVKTINFLINHCLPALFVFDVGSYVIITLWNCNVIILYLHFIYYYTLWECNSFILFYVFCFSCLSCRCGMVIILYILHFIYYYYSLKRLFSIFLMDVMINLMCFVFLVCHVDVGLYVIITIWNCNVIILYLHFIYYYYSL
jgi:hypothetical protein